MNDVNCHLGVAFVVEVGSHRKTLQLYDRNGLRLFVS